MNWQGKQVLTDLPYRLGFPEVSFQNIIAEMHILGKLSKVLFITNRFKGLLKDF